MTTGSTARDDLGQVLHRLVPAWDAARIEVISTLPGGYSHRNCRIAYSGESFVIRLPAEANGLDDARFEDRWLRAMPPGLGAEIVAFDPDSGALLSRWIDAPLLVDTTASPDALVDYLVDLHRRMPWLERAYDLSARVDRWLGGTRHPEAVRKARQKLEQPGAVLRPCHNDLNPWNILCDPLGWRTLDWEWVGLNDPLFDLVTLGLGAGISPADLPGMTARYLDRQARSFQEGRNQPAGQMKQEGQDGPMRLEQAILGFWLREYAWAFDALREGNTRDEVHAQRHHALARLQEIARD